MKRSEEIKNFIEEHQALFWYSSHDKRETVSDELLVETMINYGSLNDLNQLFEIMGLKNVAAIFRGMTERKRQNIYPELRNYFELYFDKYVSRNSL